MVVGTYISIITLNVNGLNASTKRHRLVECIPNKTIYMLSTRDPFQTQGHIQTESEGMEKDIPRKWKSKESWSQLYSHQIKQTLKQTVTRDKEGHYIMIKGSIQEEDITIVNIYAPNIGAPQYIR